MGQHRRSRTNHKELIVIAIFVIITLISIFFAWNTLNSKEVQDSAVIEPEIKSTAIAIPEIVVPSNSEVQYIKPQVKTEPAPIKRVVPPVVVEPPAISTPKPEVEQTQAPVQTTPVVAPEMAYINSVFAKYNYWANPITKWHFVNALPDQCIGDACVKVVSKSDTGEVISIDLYMKPTAVQNDYVIIHEAVHTNGIMDECLADAETTKIRGTTEGQGFYQCDR